MSIGFVPLVDGFADRFERLVWVGWMVDFTDEPVGPVLDGPTNIPFNVDYPLPEWC